MNLISCDNCGVVLDVDKIEQLPMHDDEGNFIKENIAIENLKYFPAIMCPICKNKYIDPRGEI
jgi:hypothetical protein